MKTYRVNAQSHHAVRMNVIINAAFGFEILLFGRIAVLDTTWMMQPKTPAELNEPNAELLLRILLVCLLLYRTLHSHMQCTIRRAIHALAGHWHSRASQTIFNCSAR